MKQLMLAASLAASLPLLMAEEQGDAPTGAGPTEATATPAAAPVDPNASWTNVATKFHFKTEKIKDEEGKVIGEGTKRKSFELQLPRPTAIGIINIIRNGDTEAGKAGLELLLDACYGVVYDHARWLLNSEVGKNYNADNFPLAELDWDKIAATPKSERAGAAISKEDWDAFFEDYVLVMVPVTGKEKERVARSASILRQKYNPVRLRKDLVEVCHGFLQVWFTNSTKQEDFAEIYQYLNKRGTDLLASTDDLVSDAL